MCCKLNSRNRNLSWIVYTPATHSYYTIYIGQKFILTFIWKWENNMSILAWFYCKVTQKFRVIQFISAWALMHICIIIINFLFALYSIPPSVDCFKTTKFTFYAIENPNLRIWVIQTHFYSLRKRFRDLSRFLENFS